MSDHFTLMHRCFSGFLRDTKRNLVGLSVIALSLLLTSADATAAASGLGDPGFQRGQARGPEVSHRADALPRPRHLVSPYTSSSPIPGTPQQSEGPQEPVFLQPIAPAALAEWTYMVFMDGDNNLEEYVLVDIEAELGVQGSSAQVQVVALADRSPEYTALNGNWTETLYYHIQQGQAATPNDAIADWGERNMGDPETLVEFIEFTRTYFPARRYALVFWDHGWTWRPGWTLTDETDADSLDLDEVGYALRQTGPVDLVAWDACLMSTIEVEAAFRPHTRVLVASEDYVGYEGFYHDIIVSELRASPSLGPDELGILMGENLRDRTITVVRLDETWDQFLAAFGRWSDLLLEGLPTHQRAYERAWRNTKGFADPLTKDLRDAVSNIRAEVDDREITAASDELLALHDAVILYEWHRDPYTRANGITVFWPQGPRDLDAPSSEAHDFEFYQNRLELSHQTSWDEFIYAYATR